MFLEISFEVGAIGQTQMVMLIMDSEIVFVYFDWKVLDNSFSDSEMQHLMFLFFAVLSGLASQPCFFLIVSATEALMDKKDYIGSLKQ